MSIPVLRYDLDITGTNENNLIAGETKTLSTSTQRVLAPAEGPFYAESFAIWDNVTGTKLTYGTQYKFIEILQDATAKYGKAIYGAVLITDTTVSGTVRYNYQCLGGYFKQNTDAIYALYETVINDNRSIDWATGILNKPLEYNPALHRHLLEDVYGFEPVVVALERIRNAILMNDVPVLEELISTYSGISENISNHIANKSNPHNVSASQVGLGSVVNGGMATVAEVNAGSVTNRYINPYTLKVVLDVIRSSITDLGLTITTVNNSLTTHVNDLDAHGLTAIRSRLTTIENTIPTLATLTQYNTLLNSHNTLSSTVTALSSTVSALNTTLTALNTTVSDISSSLSSHTGNKSNPHAVTAAQVGAYTIAQVDSLLLTANNAINTVTNNLNTHVNNKSNPHETTAAQVGLGSVVNGGMATVAEANIGTSTTTYINPSVLKTLLDDIRDYLSGIYSQLSSNSNSISALETLVASIIAGTTSSSSTKSLKILVGTNTGFEGSSYPLSRAYVTFTLTETTSVLILFKTKQYFGSEHELLLIDGNEVVDNHVYTSTITGINPGVAPSNHKVVTLGPGEHTIDTHYGSSEQLVVLYSEQETNIGGLIAGLETYAVGTYIMASSDNDTYPGAYFSGSSLYNYTGATDASDNPVKFTAYPGTWKCLGYAVHTLFVRVA